MTPPRLVMPAGAPEDEWLKRRLTGIGSSDIPALLGLSKYSSPYSLWADKLSPAEPENPDDGPLYWGKWLEEPIAQSFAARNNMHLVRPGMWQSGDSDIALANPDRLAAPIGINPNMDNVEAIEIKNVSGWMGGEWSGERPDAADVTAPIGYVAQLQWQLGVLGISRGWLVGLVGGQWYHQIEYHFDAQAFADMVATAEAFWSDHVLTGNPPPVDGHPATTRLLKSLAATQGETIIADPAVIRPIIAGRAAVKAEIKRLQADCDVFDNQLRATAGSAEVVIAPGLAGDDAEVLYTFRQSQTGRRLHVPTSTTARKGTPRRKAA